MFIAISSGRSEKKKKVGLREKKVILALKAKTKHSSLNLFGTLWY